MNTRTKTRKLAMIAMLCALAYLVMMIGRIPIVLFLKYDPKDVIITIGGFLFGPLASFAIATVVALVEMFSVSETGIIGCIMNIISSCSFACTAAFIYKKKHTLSGAVMGLTAGCLLMTSVMLLWNYLITPIYMGYPRAVVADMLLPAFLPFNLLKSGLNTALTLLLYKPVVTVLRKTRLIESSGENSEKAARIGTLLVAGLLLVTCIFFGLVLKGFA